MSKYNKDMVCPAPWTRDKANNNIYGAIDLGTKTGHLLIYATINEDGNAVIEDIMEEGDPHILHMIHCVNEHDELVRERES